jgi:hypothetical protein
MSTASRLIVAALLLVGLITVAPAWAQQAQEEIEQVRQAEAAAESEGQEDVAEEEGRLWAASFFGGEISAGNPVGTVENPFFNTTFKTGRAAMWGFRASRMLWWRLGAEGEFGRGSPGVNAILTSPNGSDRTEVFYANLDLSYVSGSVIFEAASGRWMRAFLNFGFAGVFVSGDREDSDNSALGILFGGGVEVPIVEDRFFVRADVRGLRSDFGLLGLNRGQLVGLESDSLSTNAMWTIGAGIRF